MQQSPTSSRRSAVGRRALVAVAAGTLLLGAAACGSGDGGGSGSTGGAGGEKIGVALITKDSSNPFFVAMQKGAKADADKNNVSLTVASGKQEGDDAGQITAIEDAIARGDKGILITPMSTGVNAAMKKARDAGLYVIALDTPPDPADTVDITFATDNREAGKLDGKWAAAQLDGKPAVIALLDLFNDKIVSVDYNRDQGFLEGMGIDVKDGKKNGDEAKTGKYTGGKGGDYTIVCNEAGNGGEDGGRTAMEKCLSKNPDINLVYTINEPTAVGANGALQAQGKTALIVSVDGGCAGVKSVKDGVIGATAQQYPLKMATLGMEAIAKIATGGEKPKVSPGLDFYNTGVALVTDKKVDGLDSITSDEGAKICWGN
ncbi:substrate-binding domain-containing protein [Terrabacter sp. MAHUQ-38]|uniref:substrate-binding domain-containing protein n=1 Tax=unclassified Terrabacter TaxID=2630222 RepID=UPI00165D563B|nr:substrate-binding domain-containing protein [Terrabacter sp. MAHUQ-38]MBC9820211.1 substrate-binding domain-containing protein [Terrabacter sp. MAHUQ-38]